jgi:hypothetical protein
MQKLNHVLIFGCSPVIKKKSKAFTVTGHGGPQGCEMSRLEHFLDNCLTDGGEVVSLTCQLPFTPRKIPGSHFCYAFLNLFHFFGWVGHMFFFVKSFPFLAQAPR